VIESYNAHLYEEFQLELWKQLLYYGAIMGELYPVSYEEAETSRLLDARDPIDVLVIDYKKAVQRDHLLTERENRELIGCYQRHDLEAGRQLVRSHRGLVAAVAYPFKDYAASEDLLVAGSKSLLAAALSYDLQTTGDFQDHIIVSLRTKFESDYPDTKKYEPEDYGVVPMAKLVMFVHDLHEPETDQERSQLQLRRMLPKVPLGSFGLTERRVLPVLHLPGEEASRRAGLQLSSIRSATHRVSEKFGAQTREELAIELHRLGVRYDLLPPPLAGSLTVRERLVAACLYKRNPEIAVELGMTEKTVGRSVQSLLRKTHARTRTELALMAHVYRWRPTSHELADKTPEVFKKFPSFQRPILERLDKPSEMVCKELGLSEWAVQGAITRAMAIAGVKTRTALALQLHEQGITFDVPEPARPLAEILNEQELYVARSLGEKNQTIAVQLGLPVKRVHDLVGYVKFKTGISHRAALALMVKVHDSGESKQPYHNVLPREERFFAALGIAPRPFVEARSLLRFATPRQTEYLEAYYFSEEQLSWRGVAKLLKVQRPVAIQIANRGLARIRESIAATEHLAA
jgi:DNA-binding CsgD family transcriptional regulator